MTKLNSMQNSILEINNLHVSVESTPILQGLNLKILPGEIHAVMGPNGSGKSTLAHVLARKPEYTVQSGQIHYLGEDLLQFSPEDAATSGIFLGFQYPIAIPGVSNIQFLKSSLNAIRAKQGKPPLDAVDFLHLVKEKMKLLEMPEELLYRSVNDGFSGGEKKRNEILQMSLLEPKLIILDETDSGLDIDALKIVAQGVNRFRSSERAILLITHYQRLLDYIEPDHIHVMAQGKMVYSGDKNLALILEEKGYGWLEESIA